MKSRRQRTNDDDPLTQAIAPPTNESQHQRELRMRAEQEAQRISDAIDDELNRQRIADKRSPKPIKILLLGQSESGKSTTLKNFQIMHSPKVSPAPSLCRWLATLVSLIRPFVPRRLTGEASSKSTSSSPSTPSSTSYPEPMLPRIPSSPHVNRHPPNTHSPLPPPPHRHRPSKTIPPSPQNISNSRCV